MGSKPQLCYQRGDRRSNFRLRSLPEMHLALHTGGAGDRVREQELHNRRTFLEFKDADLETGLQPRRLRGEMLRLPNAALQVSRPGA